MDESKVRWKVTSIVPGLGSMETYELVTLFPIQRVKDVLWIKITARKGMFVFGAEYNIPIQVSQTFPPTRGIPRIEIKESSPDLPLVLPEYKHPIKRKWTPGVGKHVLAVVEFLKTKPNKVPLPDIVNGVNLPYRIVYDSLMNHLGRLFLRDAQGLWSLIKKENENGSDVSDGSRRTPETLQGTGDGGDASPENHN